jgi:hypothetical protein
MKSVAKAMWVICSMISLIAMSTLSCEVKRESYLVSLSDSIQHAIRIYTSENHINPKSRVILADWVVNPYRTDVYISNTFREFLDNPDHVPSYYSIVSDSIVVLVYTGTETELGRNTQGIQKELNNLLDEAGIKLQSDARTTIHVKTWLYSSCGGTRNSTIVREPSGQDLLYIPCRDKDN